MTLAEWAALGEDIDGERVDGVLEKEDISIVLHEVVVLWLGATLRSWARRRRRLATGSETKLAVGRRRGRKPPFGVPSPALPAPSDTFVRVPAYVVVEVASPRHARPGATAWRSSPTTRASGSPTTVGLPTRSSAPSRSTSSRDRRYAGALSAAQGRVRVPGCPGSCSTWALSGTRSTKRSAHIRARGATAKRASENVARGAMTALAGTILVAPSPHEQDCERLSAPWGGSRAPRRASAPKRLPRATRGTGTVPGCRRRHR